MKPRFFALLAMALLLALAACTQQGAAPSAGPDANLDPAAIGNGALWRFAGHDLGNTRQAGTEAKIDPTNAADLAARWVLTTGGDVSATPAVDGTSVYVPDWAGNLFRADRATGAIVWQLDIAAALGVPGDVATTTPAIHDGVLYLGDQGGRTGQGARVLAVDAETGSVLWVTQVDAHPAALVSQSAAVFDGRVYVGVSSFESTFAALVPGYACCSFRGSVVALDAATGAIVWKTLTAPDGYSGNGVAGGMPAIDPKRGQLVVTTENNTSVPQDVEDCVAAAGADPIAQQACTPADDLFDAIVALDMRTGAIRWATRTTPYDTWTDDCLPFFGSGTNCPEPAGPDHDFSQGAALYKVHPHGGPPRDVVGAGQQSGQYWALDADTGAILWATQAGPGGVLGGLVGGSAVDGERVYVADANSASVPWVLPSGATTTAGLWSALDNATGEVLWQTANPYGAPVLAPVTAANGVLFGCSLDPVGHMLAIDASTGDVLWSFESGGSCGGGASVVNGTVYWGSGASAYGGLSGGFLNATANDKLYAFDVPR